MPTECSPTLFEFAPVQSHAVVAACWPTTCRRPPPLLHIRTPAPHGTSSANKSPAMSTGGKRGPETCGLCHYFLDPDECVLVEGPVNAATGWCNYGATTG